MVRIGDLKLYVGSKEEYQYAIYLNMIDGDDPKYVNDDMINPALDFIHQHLRNDHEVFIYCSLGESRSPSIALMYLLEHGLIERGATTMENIINLNYTAYLDISIGHCQDGQCGSTRGYEVTIDRRYTGWEKLRLSNLPYFITGKWDLIHRLDNRSRMS